MLFRVVASGLLMAWSLVLCGNPASAATIISTTTGGSWTDTLTWVGHQVPDSLDNVTINGYVWDANPAIRCHDLLVNTGKKLELQGNGYVRVNGSLVNHGTITSTAGAQAYLQVAGNISNQGIWDIWWTTLTGTLDQHITCGTERAFAGLYFHDYDTTSAIIVDSNLYFVKSEVDLHNNRLVLQPGRTVSVDSGFLSNAHIQGDGINLRMSNNAFLCYGQAEKITLLGRVQIRENFTFLDSLTIADTLRAFENSWSARATVQANGHLRNNGYILNNPNGIQLFLEAAGNIVNNGVWANYITGLNGSAAQYLTCVGQHAFSGELFYDYDATSATIAASDLYFKSGQVNLQYGALDMGTGQTLYLDSVAMITSVITGTTPAIHMQNGGCLASCSLATTGGVAFTGCVVSHGYVTVNDVLTVTDTLAGYGLTVNDNIINNGCIMDHPDGSAFYIYAGGEIVNNGIWSNTYTTLTGAGTQRVFLTQPFAGGYLSNESGKVLADTDMVFTGTHVDLGADTLEFTRAGLRLSLIDGSLQGGTSGQGFIIGTRSVLDLAAGAYLAYLSLATDSGVTLAGQARVSSQVICDDAVLVTDTLTAHNGGIQFAAKRGITNNGRIMDNGANQLEIVLYGDLVNNGVWTNSLTRLVDSVDQRVSLRQPFGGAQLKDERPGRNLIADTNLVFDHTLVDLRADTLKFTAPGCRLELAGGYLANTIYYYKKTAITGSNLSLWMSDSASLGYMSFATQGGLTMHGRVVLYNSVDVLDSITVHDTLTAAPGVNTTLTASSHLTNRGAILDNGSTRLSIDVGGDIVNHGAWANYLTKANGTHDQRLSLCRPFSGANLHISKSGGVMAADTTLAFNGTAINFDYGAYDTLRLTQASAMLDLDSGLISHVVLAGTKLTMRLRNGAYAQNVNINTTGGVTLRGRIMANQYSGLPCLLINDSVLVVDTVCNYGGHSTMAINGKVVNNGCIVDADGFRLTLQVASDLVNNGTWANHTTSLNGLVDQHVSLRQPFCGTVFEDWYPSGSIVVDTTMRFIGTTVYLVGDTLQFLPAAAQLILEGGCLRQTTMAAQALTMRAVNGAYIENVVVNASGGVDLTGCTRLNGVTFNGDVTVHDTLTNLAGNSLVTVNGSVANEGILTDEGGYTLSLNVSRNVTNSGTWSNFKTILQGSADQAITLDGGAAINNIQFNSLLGSGRWYNNSDTVAGAVSPDLFFTSLDGNALGTYVYRGTAAVSRAFVVSMSGPEKRFVNGMGTYDFPGKGVTLEVLSLTGADTVAVELYAGQLPPNLPGVGMPVQRYFDINKGSGITGMTARLTLRYTQQEFTASDIDDKADLYCARFNGSEWVPYGATDQDTLNNTISCVTSEFSLWAIGGEGGPVPVTLSSFTAQTIGSGVTLAWTTVSEQNNLGFNVLRSVSASGPFARINGALIPGAGNVTQQRNYAYTDAGATAGTWYYQLEMVDLDGRSQYSDVVAALVSATAVAVTPVTVSSVQAGRLVLYDLQGVRMQGAGVAPGVYLTQRNGIWLKVLIAE
jgi:hypothetical protein